MTVASNINKHTYIGNGVTTSWPFKFDIFKESDIQVIVTDKENYDTIQANNYTVDMSDKTVIYPTNGPPLVEGMKLTLNRLVPMTQEIALPNQGPYFSKTVEAALDKLTIITQQQQEQLDRAIKVSVSKSNAVDLQNLATYAIQAQDGAAAAQRSANEAATSAGIAEAAKSAVNATINSAVAQATASANSAANSAAASAANAFAATAPAYSPTTVYSFPTVVACTNGHSYRCIGTNITGEDPPTSPNWVMVTAPSGDFFEIDEVGNLMPSVSPIYSGSFILDGNGDIMPI